MIPPLKEMTGAEMVIQALKDHGVEHIFGYPGGAVLPIYDALFAANDLVHVLVRHEQGAIHAAEGYARSTGKCGVALVTSGPGATNAVTGLADALLDSIPLVVLSGQVATHLIGTDAFQECDTVGITRPCTKHNWLVRDVNDLAKVLHEAFYVATTGRPGPVVVDVPKDVQFAVGTYHPPRKSDVHVSYVPRVKGDAVQIRKAVALLAGAKRPVIYSGGGVINSGLEASKLLRELVEVTGVPITSTLMGLGAYPASGKNWLGMLGMHGTYEANMAMHDCDVMLCVGARFDDRITGRTEAFSPGSKKIHIDIDPSSINKNIRVDVPIIGDCANILGDLLQVFKAEAKKPDLKAWWQEIATWRARHSLSYRKSNDVIMPQYAIQRLFELTRGRDTYITTEVGQHQMWAAQFFGFEEPHRWMTSGGLGTMGYGLPAAIGVQVAHRDSLVIDIAGDASVQMTMQEMSTAVQFNLPIKIFILNNQYMGMVRQWQQLLHGNRLSHSYSEAMPDFVKMAEAYGAVGFQVFKAEAKKPDIRGWWQEIAVWRARNSLSYKKNNDIIMPQFAIQRLFENTRGRDVYITTEVGQHQMWAAQFFGFEEPHRWMTSGGLGTMGYGLPAAIGVQVAHRDSLVIDIAGDASVQMTMQEMSTAVQFNLPIKIFILNNQYMGMVRQWQQLLHGNRLSHSYSEALPDFVKLAEAFGCVGIRAIKPGDLDGAIQEMIDVKRPVLFDCRVAALENCFPMIPSGKAHNEMLLPAEATDEATAVAFAGGKALV